MAISGMNQLTREFNRALKTIGSVTKAGIEDCLLDLQTKSTQLAPLDTGDLRSNADTEVTEGRNGHVGILGYSLPYAERMHEDMEYRPQEPGTGPKYLEAPFVQNEKRYVNYIRSKVKEALR